MVAPPLAAMTSGLRPPSPTVVRQPKKKALLPEATPSQLRFPDEFPYEFDSSSFTGDSTETEDEITDDEDNFFAGLTRRLGLSTQRLSSPPSFVTDKADKVKPVNSTESTQSGLRSPNGPFSQAPSPPKSPFREDDDSLKVNSAAAGEVAKVKTANFVAKPISRPITSPNPNSLIPFPPQNAAFCDYSYYYWLRQSQNSYYMPAYPYPVRSVFAASNAVKPASAGTGVFAPSNAVKPASAGTGVFAPITVKPASAGTGVFIPRKYPDPSDSRQKSGGGCVKLPTKKVVHPKTEEVSGRCQARSKVNQVGGGCNVKEEEHLPKEWVY